MDRTAYTLGYLKLWQEENYNKVDSDSDIRVFNSIGTLITLVSGGLMNTTKAHEFLTEVLSLDDEEKQKAYQVYLDAYGKAMEASSDGEEV